MATRKNSIKNAPQNYYINPNPFNIGGPYAWTHGEAPLGANAHAYMLDVLEWRAGQIVENLSLVWDNQKAAAEGQAQHLQLLNTILETQQATLQTQQAILEELKKLNAKE